MSGFEKDVATPADPEFLGIAHVGGNPAGTRRGVAAAPYMSPLTVGTCKDTLALQTAGLW